MTLLAMLSLALLAGLWLVRPLLRPQVGDAALRKAANARAYQTRVDELTAEHAAGLIDAETLTAQTEDAKRRLVSDAAPQDAASAAAPQRGLAIVVLLALVLASAVFYGLQGSWQQAAQVAAAANTPDAGKGKVMPPEVREMVAKLETRLKAKPNDAEGWALLGRSYFVMERYADAGRAYGEANRSASTPNPDYLVGEAEALALSRERDLLGRPQALLDQALEIAPTFGKALWYGALAAEQAGDAPKAIARLTALAQQDLPPEIRATIVARLEALGSAGPSSLAPAVPAAAPAAGSVGLEVDVQLADGLSIPSGATLFVFAKAENGPPMPLAVARIVDPRLPMRVRLDDGMAMAPGLKMSGFASYVITARLSTSGSVTAAKGDLEGSSPAARGQDKPVSVLMR